MTPNLAAIKIAQHVQDLEDSLDDLIGQNATLLATIAEARRLTGSPMSDGHVAMLRIAKAQQSLMDVRSQILRAHQEMLKIAQVRADIATTGCPPNKASALMIVEAA